jgi:hypothetical protein
VEDEDEFEEHRLSLGYPDAIVEGALHGAAELRTMLTAAEEPFGEHYRKWLALV